MDALALTRGFAPARLLAEFTLERVVAAGAAAARATLVVEDPARAAGRRTIVLARSHELPMLVAHLQGKRQRFTGYLTLEPGQIGALDEIVGAIEPERAAFRTGVRVSFSPPGLGLGIGAHADAFDSVLVQLRGRRNWSVWPPSVLPRGYVDGLATGEPQGAVPTPTQDAQTIQLGAGDLLRIASPWVHAGSADDTAGDAISATLGFSPAHATRATGSMR